jgi:hypothetical protein
MSLRLDYVNNDKILFNDNTLVYQTKNQCDYFRILITDRGASIGRYCVPGRLDIYEFDWVPEGTGLGSRVCYFTDTHQSLIKAVAQLKRDLKKKRVKELFNQATIKVPCSHLDRLLDALR